jgi:glutamyl-tRNA reductase
MRLVCYSINFHTAPLETREAVCLEETGQRAVLNYLKAADKALEAIVLCTCNRTEIYVSFPEGHDPQIPVEKALFEVNPAALSSWRQYRQVMVDADAVGHLFRVAAGLESQMLGENQIVRQIKDAYSLSIQCGMSRFFFHKMMHATFRVSKAVRQATKITCGAVSVSMAAIETLKKKINLRQANVLLVGAGENATLAATYIQKEGVKKLTVASRTLASARHLASEFKNAEAITIQQIGEFLADADVAIFSTASPVAVLTAQEAGYYLAQRKSVILMIDLAVPRDVEPEVGQLANVELINIEQLHLQVEGNRQARAVWIEPAEKIITQHIEQFVKWLDSLDTAATISSLTETILSEAQRYAGRYRRYFAKKDQKRLEQFAEGLARKLIHRPIQYLKDNNIDKTYVSDIISSIFLSEEHKKEKK